MTGSARKLSLTLHITASVGWTGAVLTFLVLAVAGLTSDDAAFVRSVYPTLEATAWFVVLPLGIASLVTGVVQGLGTTWGLFRHWWVIVKLAINIVATVVLLLYLGSIERLADLATAGLGVDDERPLRLQAVLHSAAAAALLLGAVVLSVYKPRGMTRRGARRRSTSVVGVDDRVAPALGDQPAVHRPGDEAGDDEGERERGVEPRIP